MAEGTPEAPAAAPKKKRKSKGLIRKAIFVLLFLAIPVGGWMVLGRLNRPPTPERPPSESAGEEEDAAAAGGHGEAPKTVKLPPMRPVPLSAGTLVAWPTPGKEFEDARLPRVVVGNGTVIKPDQITALLANRGREPSYVVAEIFLLSPQTDELVKRLNEIQPTLYNRIQAYLEAKTLSQVQADNFAMVFKTEVQRFCDETLGTNLVTEVLLLHLMSK